MEQSKNIMFYDMCRLCLDERGFRDILKEQCLSDHIYKCIGIKISINDNLPQKICAKCLEIVNKATELRIAARSNEFHLKSLFGVNEDEQLQEPSKKSSQPTSPCCEKEGSTEKTSPSTEKFISVRKDLFISSVSEDSIIQTDAPQMDSSEVPISKKGRKCKDHNTDAPQMDSSEVPISKKGRKCKDHNIDAPQMDSFQVTISKMEQKYKDGNTDAPQKDSSQVPISIKRLRYEDGNTEFQCSICSKKFDKWKKVYLHGRLHNKNYGCPLCTKMFSTKGDLEKHTRTHTGEKPYQCDYCDKSFSQRGTLKSHKEAIHSVG